VTVAMPSRIGRTVHRELKRKHVTPLIVWDEYIAGNPSGYSYSRFCELYRAFESKLSPTMRQTHAAGERLFVNYAGDGVPVVIDRLTGEIRKAQIFVAVLGASSFTFARATWTQTLVDWIDAHAHAFDAIGGAPHLRVPDNTKAAVVEAYLYNPLVNRTYAEMAAHYDTAILPQRGRGVRGTRRKSSKRCSSWRDGSSGGCVIGPFTASPRSMRRSANSCGFSTKSVQSGGSA
jgi:transposase